MTHEAATVLASLVTAEHATLLGFGGWRARVTGQSDTRPDGLRLRHRLRDTVQLDAARELSAALDAAGVDHAFGRGVALLAAGLYRPGERTIEDLDCYVGRSDVPRAVACMNDLGFCEAGNADAPGPVGMARGFDLVREGGMPVAVDLHWGLPRVDRLISYGEEGPVGEIVASAVAAHGLRLPDPSAHLALVLHHLVHHDLLHARGVVDAVLLWSGLPETATDRLAALARRWRVRRVAAALDAHFGARLGWPRTRLGAPGAAARAALDPARLFPMAAASDPAEVDAISLARIRRRLDLLDRRWVAGRLLRDIIFPPATYLRWRWPGAALPTAWWRHVRRQASRVMFPA